MGRPGKRLATSCKRELPLLSCTADIQWCQYLIVTLHTVYMIPSIVQCSSQIAEAKCFKSNDINNIHQFQQIPMPVCYILCCRNSISCSHIGYIPCGCNLCSIGAISIICVHFKVFKCSFVRSSLVRSSLVRSRYSSGLLNL